MKRIRIRVVVVTILIVVTSISIGGKEAAKEVAIQDSGVWDTLLISTNTPKEEELIAWQQGAGVTHAEWKPEFALAFPRAVSPFDIIPPAVFTLLSWTPDRTRAVDLKGIIIYCQQMKLPDLWVD